MALDLEEQEQLAELKAWWKQNGGRILSIIVAVAVGFAGWVAFRSYSQSQSVQASALYESVAKAAQANDAKALRDASGTLVESYPGTAYASMGALVAARYYFDRNDLKNAKAQLQWVLERGSPDDFKHLVPRVLEYELPYFPWTSESDLPSPNVFVSMDAKALKAKLKALSLYKSQMKVKHGPISEHGAETLARMRGVHSGTLAAEAFMLRRAFF